MRSFALLLPQSITLLSELQPRVKLWVLQLWARGATDPTCSFFLLLLKHLPWIQHKYFGRCCLGDIRAPAPGAQGYWFSFSGQEPRLDRRRYSEERRQSEETWPSEQEGDKTLRMSWRRNSGSDTQTHHQQVLINKAPKFIEGAAKTELNFMVFISVFG